MGVLSRGRIGACAGLLGLGAACGVGPSQTQTPDPVDARAIVPEARPQAERDAEALLAAKEAATTLKVTLKGRLVQALGEGGPEAAVAVCQQEAQALTAKIAADTRVKVGRASLRLRNPVNEGPDWVQAWLVAQGERKADGVEPFEEIVDTPDGRVARVIERLPVGAPCLVCHGDRSELPEGVQAVLATHYPEDQAVGYAIGDLRGGVWAEAGVAPGDVNPDGPVVPETPEGGGSAKEG